MPILSPKTGALREAVLAGELSGRDLLIEKREFHLKAEQPGEWTDAATGRHYEVVGREADGDLVTFFVRAWTAADKKTQFAFGRPGKAVGIERFRFQNIPTLTEDPLGGFEECGLDEDTGLVKTRPKLIEDPLLVARELIRQQVGLTARIDAGADFKATGRTVTTFYPAAGANSPVDGFITRGSVNETFAAIIAGVGTSAGVTNATQNTAGLNASTTTNQFSTNRRGIFCYDTSAIGPDGVSDGVFSLFLNTKSNGLGDIGIVVLAATPAATNNLAASDYGQIGSTGFGSAAYSALTAGMYNDIVLSAAGRGNINTSGISKFGTKSDWDHSASFTGAWVSLASSLLNVYFADQTGTTNDPKLTVTHAAAAGATSREPQPARFKNGRWHYYGRC